MSISLFLRLLLLSFLLGACTGEVPQVSGALAPLSWPEEQLVYVADGRIGTVLAMSLQDQSRLLARTQVPTRTRVLDLQLDKARNLLWVLGPDGVDVHDAHSLVVRKHIALPRGEVTSLQRDEYGVSLLSASRELRGRIDGRTLISHRDDAPRPENS